MLTTKLWRYAQPAPFAGMDEELRRALQTVRHVLTQNILPFWFPRTLDLEFGGYALNHDVAGKWKGHARKRLVTQARMVWFFSAVAQTPFGSPEHLHAARHGYRFLCEQMWDSDCGGFYWEVEHGGAVSATGKHLYGQAFALYALSEYARASGDSSAQDMADRLWAVMEDKAHDSAFGGYVEAFDRDWVEQDGPGHLSDTPGVKLMNTHLHILEALVSYYRLNGTDQVRQRIAEMVLILSNAIVHRTPVACSDKHERNWTPVKEDGVFRVSYGHDLENIWLLSEACRVAAIPVAPLLRVFQGLFANALRFGLDRRKGGFCLSGPLGRRADQRAKVWWVQAEALVAALEMYGLTENEQYLLCFHQTLEWIARYQVDWSNGDWHANVARGGKPSGNKAGIWKSPYHNGRAMLECGKRLERLIARKNMSPSGAHSAA